MKSESASSASAVQTINGEVVSSKEAGEVSKEERATLKLNDGLTVNMYRKYISDFINFKRSSLRF